MVLGYSNGVLLSLVHAFEGKIIYSCHHKYNKLKLTIILFRCDVLYIYILEMYSRKMIYSIYFSYTVGCMSYIVRKDM